MLTTNPVRALALLATLASVALAAAVLVHYDGDVLAAMRTMRLRGHTPYALCLGWLTIAPLPMVVSSSYVPISVSPWIVVALIDLGVIVAFSLEHGDRFMALYWVSAVVCGVGCVSSVVAAAAGHGPRSGDF